MWRWSSSSSSIVLFVCEKLGDKLSFIASSLLSSCLVQVVSTSQPHPTPRRDRDWPCALAAQSTCHRCNEFSLFLLPPPPPSSLERERTLCQLSRQSTHPPTHLRGTLRYDDDIKAEISYIMHSCRRHVFVAKATLFDFKNCAESGVVVVVVVVGGVTLLSKGEMGGGGWNPIDHPFSDGCRGTGQVVVSCTQLQLMANEIAFASRPTRRISRFSSSSFFVSSPAKITK